jgi:Na+-transporting NADH:ubiquinone oxidoreductase subunit C
VRQSNAYVIFFAVIMTIVVGGLLSIAATGLAPAQKKARELDTRRQILGAVMDVSQSDNDQVLEIYSSRVKSLVVDFKGKEVTEQNGEKVIAENVNVSKNFKKAPEDRLYPVFQFLSENGEKVESYILPIYGNGLWDNIWGFLALDTDLKTVKGVVFDHKGETPGLGARITDKPVMDRYQGKKIYDDKGEFVSVRMVKGENTPESRLGPHRVDGMSGATITANGVNDMLERYLSYYKNYFETISGEGNLTLAE